MCNMGLCNNCKLRVGHFCFSNYEPEEILGEMLACEYYTGDAITSYYEFIDGFQWCKRKTKLDVNIIEKRAKNEILRRLKMYLSIDPNTIDLRKAIEIIINEESEND